MRVNESDQVIELTRTNLRALLAKLDGNPPHSTCTLFKDGWLVVAVEDNAHYSTRPRGIMHPATETAIAARGWLFAADSEVDL